MKKIRLYFFTVNLIFVLMALSCASNTLTQSAPVDEIALATETLRPVDEAPTAIVLTEEVPTVQAVATSRGPNLHATDPSTVSLASGQLQLVEFFRYT